MKKEYSGAKILLIDIETSPMLGWAWRKWQADLIAIHQDWKLLMVGYKWLHEKHAKVLTGRLLTEKELVEETWALLDAADIVVAHNGDSFDIKKVQAKLKEYKLSPPSPFKSVDTRKVAKNHFAFSSNKLDDLGSLLQIGKKMETGGFKLWLEVMSGDKAAWQRMEKYCQQDVLLLEKLYTELRPWMPRHPNLAVYAAGKVACGQCGSNHLHRNKEYRTNTGTYVLYKCTSCGGYTRSRKQVSGNTTSTIVADRK